jgi:hypothetical protein
MCVAIACATRSAPWPQGPLRGFVACATRSAPWPQGPLKGFVHAAGGWAVRPVGLAVQSGRAGRRRIGCLHEEPSCNIVPPPCLLSRPPNSGTLRTPLEPGVSWNGHGSACPRWTGIRSWLFEIYLRSEYRWSQTAVPITKHVSGCSRR